MHLKIRCDECDHRQRTERTFFWPQRVYLICHECETPLVVHVTTEALARGIYQRVAA
jgi:RNase P subunit RPR2